MGFNGLSPTPSLPAKLHTCTPWGLPHSQKTTALCLSPPEELLAYIKPKLRTDPVMGLYFFFLIKVSGLPWWSSGWDSTFRNAGGLGSITGQGTRSHAPQLKIPHATTETQRSQINKYKKKKKLKYPVNQQIPFLSIYPWSHVWQAGMSGHVYCNSICISRGFGNNFNGHQLG